MTHSPTIGALAADLSKAQGQLKPALFDKTNPHFRNKYATLPAIAEAARVQLAANGLAVMQGFEAEGPVVKGTTMLVHKSGEWMSSTLTMTAQQNTPQGIGSTITYLRRYGLAAMVGIVADDALEDDGEEGSRNHTPPPPPPPRPGTVLWNRLAKRDGQEKARRAWNDAVKATKVAPHPPHEMSTEDAAKMELHLFPLPAGEAAEADAP